MKIVNAFPPNYRLLLDFFGEDKEAVYCYGDTIYNPYNRELTEDIVVHESVHCRQQDNKIEEWYNKYILDENFRFSQEVEAYGEQLKFLYKKGFSSKLRDAALDMYAESLYEKYGLTQWSFEQIKTAIRKYAKRD